ncbi:Acyltransferase ws dgat mgat family protein [Globisporangium polare]
MATASSASASPMGEFLQLLFQGPPQHQAVLLVLGSLALVWVVLRFKKIRDDAAAQANAPAKPTLRRKMSSIGMTTRVSEIDTNLSIPVNVLKISGRISTQQLVARLQQRMDEDPFFTRFRSIAVDRDHTFVEIPNFDVSRNVFSHLVGEGESALEYVESLVNRPFDASKPLWEMHAILDLSDATQEVTHIAWKTHHCIGDGASQSTALVRLSDNKDQFDEMIRKMQESANAQAKSSRSQRKNVTLQLRQFAENAAMLTALLSWSAYVVVKKALQLVVRSEPKTLFKKKGGTVKRLSYTNQYSVATTKQIGKKHKATVNDIMLTCVAGAMRKTMLAVGEKVDPKLVVRAAVPVDMRSMNEAILSAQNKFSALVLDFPIGVADPEKRLVLIKSGMNEAKFSLEKNFTYGLSHVVAKLPTFLIEAIVRFTGSRMSVAISNVRGSSVGMDMWGGRVVGFYGFMPPPPTVNLGIAILSVGDDLGLNVLVDPCVGIDSQQFLKFAEEEYEELKRCVLAEGETATEQKKDK